MTQWTRCLVLLLPVVVACTPRPSPQPVAAARYVVGEPYQLGAIWSYPREDFGLRETGLATVLADRASGRITTNGEVYDPDLLTAAHRTVQLPAILVVTNLENGFELRVRVNDRGPAQTGRVIAVSRRAAELLRIQGGGTRVAIAVDGEASRRLAAGLPQPESTRIAIATAPREALQTESLAPPPGSRSAERVRQAPETRAFATMPAEPAAASAIPQRLPEAVSQGIASAGELFVEASTFTAREAAQRQASRLPGARVEAFGPGRRQEYRVRLGPYGSVAQADQGLEMAYRSGVSDARILVD